MRLLGKALTFDDVLLVPAYSQVLPKDTSLATQFTRKLRLNLPLVSAAMDICDIIDDLNELLLTLRGRIID